MSSAATQFLIDVLDLLTSLVVIQDTVLVLFVHVGHDPKYCQEPLGL